MVNAPAQQQEPDPSGPGLFIVYEGGEGAGKSTQLRLLHQWLSELGHEVISTREPGGTAIGEEIRNLVTQHGHGEIDPLTEALLFAASRAAHTQQVIAPALARGAVVLSDRFVDSSLAYQGAGRGLGIKKVAELNASAVGSTTPDLTIVLDIEPELSAARRSSRDDGAAGDRIESADLEFHTTLRKAFLTLARKAPQDYLVLDGSVEPEAIQRQSRVAVEKLLRVRDASPMGASFQSQMAGQVWT